MKTLLKLIKDEIILAGTQPSKQQQNCIFSSLSIWIIYFPLSLIIIYVPHINAKKSPDVNYFGAGM